MARVFARFAALVLASGLPASAETGPLTIEGIDWGNCLDLVDQHIDMYAEHGGILVDQLAKQFYRSAAIATEDEFIIVTCERRNRVFYFTVEAAPR